jgi:succinate-acetate transporter protein
MTIASAKTSGAVFGVFIILSVTFIFLAIGELGSSTSMSKVGGYLGILTAIAAWYASAAGVTNATWKRTVFPTWPRA